MLAVWPSHVGAVGAGTGPVRDRAGCSSGQRLWRELRAVRVAAAPGCGAVFGQAVPVGGPAVGPASDPAYNVGLIVAFDDNSARMVDAGPRPGRRGADRQPQHLSRTGGRRCQAGSAGWVGHSDHRVAVQASVGKGAVVVAAPMVVSQPRAEGGTQFSVVMGSLHDGPGRPGGIPRHSYIYRYSNQTI